MNKNRLEAFSDGVIAIIITIMVLDLKSPIESTWNGLLGIVPVFISYLLSFILVGVYWNNHHHLIHAAKTISSKIMWANLTLLFFLSLIPFGTKWMGETHFKTISVVLYAIILFFCGNAYTILQNQIANSLKNSESNLKQIIKKQNTKVIISTVANILAVPSAYIDTKISLALFALSSIIWIIPSKELEEEISKTS